MKKLINTDLITDSPNHYSVGNYEAIDVIADVLQGDFKAYCVGNVLKYMIRAEYKGGLSDYKKALDYLKLIIDFDTPRYIKFMTDESGKGINYYLHFDFNTNKERLEQTTDATPPYKSAFTVREIYQINEVFKLDIPQFKFIKIGEMDG